MMEQGGRRGSKEWQQTHQPNGSNTTSGSYHANGGYATQNGGFAPPPSTTTDGVASGVPEKPPAIRRGTTNLGNARRESNLTSPAMGTVNDMFHGLSGGMHGDEAPRPVIT